VKYSIEAIFRAIDNFTKPVDAMTLRMHAFYASQAKALNQTNALAGSVGAGIKNMSMTAVIAAGVVGSAFASIAVDVGEFERQLGAASAKFEVLNRNSKEFRGLTKQSIDLGLEYGFVPTDMAKALKELGAGGLSYQAATTSLEDIIAFNIGGEIDDLGEAAKMAVESVTLIGLESQNTEKHVAGMVKTMDLMATVANATTANVKDLHQMLLYAGPSMSRIAGYSPETIMATAGVLAKSGITASIAGTGGKNVVDALMGTRNEAARAFNRLGVSAYDEATQKLRHPIDTLRDLAKALDALSDKDKAKVIDDMFGKIAKPSAITLTAGVAAFEELEDKLTNHLVKMRDISDFIRADLKTSINQVSSAWWMFKYRIIESNAAFRDSLKTMSAWLLNSEESKLLTDELGNGLAFLTRNFGTIATQGVRVAMFFLYLTGIIKGVAIVTWVMNAALAASKASLMGTAALVATWGNIALMFFVIIGAVVIWRKELGNLHVAWRILMGAVATGLAFMLISNPFGWVVAAAAGLSLIVYYWHDILDTIKAISNAVPEWFKATFTNGGGFGGGFGGTGFAMNGSGMQPDGSISAPPVENSPIARAESIRESRTESNSNVTLTLPRGYGHKSTGSMSGLSIISTGAV
jgi:TP901 family phage tail tape measure protein